MIKLTIALIKQTFRNKENIFWILLFPLIFLFIFSLFNFESVGSINIIVIDEAQSELSASIVDPFRTIEDFGIYESTDFDQAKADLESGTKFNFDVYKETKIDEFDTVVENESADLVLFLPAELNNVDLALVDKDYNLPIKLIYDNSEQGQAAPIGIVESILGQVSNNISLGIFNGRNLYNIESEGISVQEIGYYDFLMPGIVGMGVMQSAILGIAVNTAALKEKNITKRLKATPLPISRFFITQVTTYLVLTLMQTTILIGLGTMMLGATIYGNIVNMYILIIIATLSFLSIGFIIAGVSKDSSSASSLSNLVTIPMMFLSGTFFDTSTMPEFVRQASRFLPLTPLIEGLREVALNKASLGDIKIQLLSLVIVAVVSFLVATKTFKFVKD